MVRWFSGEVKLRGKGGFRRVCRGKIVSAKLSNRCCLAINRQVNTTNSHQVKAKTGFTPLNRPKNDNALAEVRRGNRNCLAVNKLRENRNWR